jgi:glycosyltransferase involved in cell wall biosynthesis
MPGFHPLVSIVIPVYNGSNYLREAIDSALGQTYRNCEVIVVNDGSSDGGATREIALSYGSKIRCFEKENGGVSSALNLGIREMKGDYFSWLSHDDIYYPVKIERQMDLLRNMDNRLAILYGDYDRIDQTSKPIGKTVKTYAPPERMRLALINDSPVNGCTTLIPRICFDRVGIFREDLRTTQDYDMWFRLAAEFPFIHVPHPLFMSRHHPEQGTFTLSKHYAERLELFRSYLDQLSPVEIARLTAMPLALFYMNTALRFRLRGFPETAAYARTLAKKNKRDAPIFTQLFLSLLDLPYFMLTRKLKPANWFR